MKHTLSILTAVFAIVAFLVSCGGSESSASSCRVNGTVEIIGGGGPSAVKLVLEDASNPDIFSVAYSDSKGKFVFENIAPGFYYLNASKEGYGWVLTKIYDRNDHVIHNGSYVRSFELVPGTTEVSVSMSNYYDYGSGGYDDGGDRKFQILDMNGNPITSLEIENGFGNAAFQLYNGTGQEIAWSIRSSCLAVSEDGLDAVECIESIVPEKGRLDPGSSESVVLTINPLVYSYRTDFYHSLTIYDDTHISQYELNLYFK